MNDHKIAFIVCVTDEDEFQEALYYIDRLRVPEEYETDVIAVREAPSMAAGYNAAMHSSDAKYKIYMHQDVFLIYQNLLADLLEAFHSDEEIGLLGVLGCRMLPGDAIAIFRWDSGKVYCNGNPAYFWGYEKKAQESPLEVMAIDGMFMATQYDVEWREDLFDGWDFYDISQCLEFARKGKKVVIPLQKEIWTYHDNRYSRLNQFNYYREKLIAEYGDVYSFGVKANNPFVYEIELEELRPLALASIKERIDAGRLNEVCDWLNEPTNQGEPAFQEIELICKIHAAELQGKSKVRMYEPGMNYDEIIARFRRLKHLVKRIEFGCERKGDRSELVEDYSVYAVAMLVMIYAYRRKELYERILAIYQKKSRVKFEEYRLLGKAFETNGSLRRLLLHLKNVRKDFRGRRRIAILKTLNRESIVRIKEREDQKNTVILFEDYTEDGLDAVTSAEAVCGTVVKLVVDLQEKLYSDYSEVAVYGADMEEYVKVFHNTDMPVIWYVAKEEDIHQMRYSANIKICEGELGKL